MATVLQLRELADRCFAFAEGAADPALQQQARSRGYRYLKQADSLAQQEAYEVLGVERWPRVCMTPLQSMALPQLARVQAQINAIETDRPPERSARGNILSALYRKKAQLERALELPTPKDHQRRHAGARRCRDERGVGRPEALSEE